MSKYSVIIPTLNEEEYLPPVLEHLKKIDEDLEIIIADGGSKDNTVKIAERFNVKVCKSEKGKGFQLNNGAGCAKGAVLIFLHADTFLPANAFNLINKYMLVRKIDIAAFKMKFDKESFLMDMYSWFTKFDSVFTKAPNRVGEIPISLATAFVNSRSSISRSFFVCTKFNFFITKSSPTNRSVS